jgi:hypothetical protein
MPRLSLLNFLVGFVAIFLSAASGAFIAFDTSEAFLKDPGLLDSWQMITQRSAHGHTNLFGILHICLGLTLPYSALPPKFKVIQTIGLGTGTFAMSILMIVRSYVGAAVTIDALDIAIGVCLSASLAALAAHCYGLGLRLAR